MTGILVIMAGALFMALVSLIATLIGKAKEK